MSMGNELAIEENTHTHTHIFYPKEIKDQESWNELDRKKYTRINLEMN
jgi:hypothetical protein